MPTGTWALGWATGDIPTAAEFAKGAGCIFDTTLGAGAASIDVTTIAAVYAHLLVVATLRSDTAAQGVTPIVRLNNDSGANYSHVAIGGNGGGFQGGSATGATSITSAGSLLCIPAANATASVMGDFEMWLPHYAGTSLFKSVGISCGHAGNTSINSSEHVSVNGCWRSAAAINRVTVSLSAGNIVTGSKLSIYAFGA